MRKMRGGNSRLETRGSMTNGKKVEGTQKSSKEEMKWKETVQGVAKVTSNQGA
jgi:hypothetical protein